MIAENIAVKEQLVKKVVNSGNGGAVWVPKSWLWEEIVVVRLQKPEPDIKDRIIIILMPYLEEITAVFLYGSYARKEQGPDSDIDILVIAEKKLDIKKHKKADIKVMQLEKLKETIEKNPIMYLSILQEAKAIFNSPLLQELKKIQINYKKFKWFIETTIENIKSSMELIELDKIDGEYVSSYGAIYSTILRLRGAFLIKCLIDKKKYSNKLFKKWLLKHNISNSEYKAAYGIYQSIRDDKKAEDKIKIAAAIALLNILGEEINNLEKSING